MESVTVMPGNIFYLSLFVDLHYLCLFHLSVSFLVKNRNDKNLLIISQVQLFQLFIYIHFLLMFFCRYELCFNAEKAVSNGTATIAQASESETEKLQNHNTHAAQTSDRNPADRDCIIDVFRWSRCRRPYPQKVMRSIGIPLPVEHLEVFFSLANHPTYEIINFSLIYHVQLKILMMPVGIS